MKNLAAKAIIQNIQEIPFTQTAKHYTKCIVILTQNYTYYLKLALYRWLRLILKFLTVS